jgi:PAS domain S-box-containing protein
MNLARKPRPASVRKRRRYYSLRQRLLWAVRSAGLLACGMMVIGVVGFAYRAESQSWRGRQSEAAENAARKVAEFIEHVNDSLTLTLALGEDELRANPTLLRAVVAHNPALLEITLFSARGKVLASGYSDKPILANLFTIPQSQWFLQAKGGQSYVGDVQVSPVNEPYMVVALPGADGSVVAARVRMTLLWDEVGDLEFGRAGRTYVVTHTGAIIGHTDPAIVLAYTSIAGRPELAHLQQAPGNRWYGFYRNFEDTDVVGTTTPVPGTDWVILAELPTWEAFATTRAALASLLAGLVLLALAAERFIARDMVRWLFTPLERLRQAAERVGQGDFDYQPGPIEPDEIGQVAEAFREMAERVRDREAQVQAKAAALLAEFEERKHVEAALRESEARFRQFFAASPDAVLLIDPHDATTDWLIVDCNEAAGRMNGYQPEELIGQSIDLINVWPGILDERCAYLERIRQQGILQGEALHRHRDGHLFPTEVSTTLTTIGGRELLLGIERDITQRKRTDEALRKSMAAAETASRAKSEFLSRMSHELRTPMNVILGFAQLLMMSHKDPITAGQKARVQQIVNGGQHLLDVINEILDLSRIEAGRLQISPEPVRVAETLREVLDLTAPLAAEHNVQIELGEVEMADPWVQADRQRFKQILLNLLSNAIKYNHERGRVTLTCHSTGQSSWRICVRDTGPGLTTEAQQRLFMAFERLEADKSPVQGTGLGLAIAKRLTELMQGQIGVESMEGQGSTFWIELPATESQVAQLQRAGGTGTLPMLMDHDRVILYIEDNLANYELVRQVLADHSQIDLLWATNTSAGLELARQRQPNLILLDLHLNGSDGADALRQLKQNAATAAIPVLVISADATPGQVDRLLALGAEAYLTKPLNVKRFVELIDRKLGEKAN